MARIRPYQRVVLAAALIAAFFALGGSRAGTRAGATILGGGPLPTLSINDLSTNENAGTQTFTVTLSASSLNTVTVDYTTTNGTAAAGSDYTAASGTLTFNPGDLSKPIPVSITEDPFDEFDETYTVNLSNASNATVADAVGQGTIQDNDPASKLAVSDVTVTEGTGGTTNAVFTITLAPRSGKTVTVTATTVAGTATQPADYTFTNVNLTFNPGDLTKTVTVPIVTDSLDEINEALTVHLSSPTFATFDKQDGTGTITDDDPAPSISVNDVSVTEGNTGTTNAVFTLSLSAASSKTITVDAATANGTATAGLDYTAVTSPGVTFAPGDLTMTVTVPVIGDTLFEANEAFLLNLTSPNNATIGDSQGAGVIQNDDTPPSLTVNDVSVNEGDSGTVNATFTITLSPASGTTASVGFTTVAGTATSPSDYAAQAGTRTFGAGETTKSVAITINGDTTDEIDESFFVHLASPVGASISDADGQGTITDDDGPPTVSLAGNVAVTEGNSGTVNATFTANLSQQSGKAVSVDIATSDGTATAPSDYTANSTTLNFAPGDTGKSFSVSVNGDLFVEPNETLTVTLSNPTNVAIGTASAIGTITNDDTPPSASINDVSVIEGDSGTATATFTVLLSKPAVESVSVDHATTDGGATTPGDYTATSGTLTFGVGASSMPVTVLVNGDTTDELNETFLVNLSNAVGLTITDGQGQGTIIDDDGPSISIGDVSANEGTIATFTVSLSAATVQPVTVSYATADATGVAGFDYVATSGSITIQPGDTTAPIPVSTLQDFNNEPNETFFVNLSNPSGGTLSDGQGQGTIVDDDFVSLSVGDTSVTEGGSASFTVSLSGTSFQTVTVDYATADGTAVVTQDYTANSGALTFTPGDLTKTVTVATIQDPFDENDETVFVNLSNPSNATISDGQGQGIILDNDSPPKLAVADTSVTEGSGGTSNAVFSVSISPRSGKVVTVDYVTVDGTATAPTDYTTTVGSLTFNPGDLTKTVSVSVATDSTDEPDETFDLFLSNNVNAGFDDRTGTATILDDDAPPTISVNDVSMLEGESGTANATFTLTLSAASGKTATINAFTSNGTATSGSDYQTVAITGLTFNAGETTKTVNVPVIGDPRSRARDVLAQPGRPRERDRERRHRSGDDPERRRPAHALGERCLGDRRRHGDDECQLHHLPVQSLRSVHDHRLLHVERFGQQPVRLPVRHRHQDVRSGGDPEERHRDGDRRHHRRARRELLPRALGTPERHHRRR